MNSPSNDGKLREVDKHGLCSDMIIKYIKVNIKKLKHKKVCSQMEFLNNLFMLLSR